MNKFVLAAVSALGMTLSAAVLAYSVVTSPPVPPRPSGAIVNRSAQAFKAVPVKPLPPAPPMTLPRFTADRTAPKKLNSLADKCDRLKYSNCH